MKLFLIYSFPVQSKEPALPILWRDRRSLMTAYLYENTRLRTSIFMIAPSIRKSNGSQPSSIIALHRSIQMGRFLGKLLSIITFPERSEILTLSSSPTSIKEKVGG
jgi:hypothetical protein